MKVWMTLGACLLSLNGWAAPAAFPTSPDLGLTPGALCDDPDAHRYPEQIAYCNRAVGASLKERIIKLYDQKLGYRIGRMDRKLFKIDHYIPLCMGGANKAVNLWPQHESVFEVTDQLEQCECQKMADGKLRQAEAIQIMKRAKADLQEARRLLAYVQGL